MKIKKFLTAFLIVIMISGVAIGAASILAWYRENAASTAKIEDILTVNKSVDVVMSVRDDLIKDDSETTPLERETITPSKGLYPSMPETFKGFHYTKGDIRWMVGTKTGVLYIDAKEEGGTAGKGRRRYVQLDNAIIQPDAQKDRIFQPVIKAGSFKYRDENGKWVKVDADTASSCLSYALYVVAVRQEGNEYIPIVKSTAADGEVTYRENLVGYSDHNYGYSPLSDIAAFARGRMNPFVVKAGDTIQLTLLTWVDAVKVDSISIYDKGCISVNLEDYDAMVVDNSGGLYKKNYTKGLTYTASDGDDVDTGLNTFKYGYSVNVSDKSEPIRTEDGAVLDGRQIRIPAYSFDAATNRAYPVTTLSGSFASDITKLVIPEHITTTITNTMFSSCWETLKEVYLMGSCNIDSRAFCKSTSATKDGMTNLEKVVIGDKMGAIGDYAFKGCEKLRVFDMQGGTDIGQYCFRYSPIESISIPSTVKDIGVGDTANWFEGNNVLRYVYYNASAVPQRAFAGNVSLEEIIFGPNVGAIGNYACDGCSALKSATIGDNVVTINGHAFEDCGNLKTLVLGKNVATETGNTSAFDGCDAIEDLTMAGVLPGGNENVFKILGFEVSSASSNIDLSGSLKKLTITQGKIPADTFNIETADTATVNYGYNKLEEITIGKDVTEIGADAFKNCDNITKLKTPDVGRWSQIKFGNAASNPLSYASCVLYVDNKPATDLIIPDTISDTYYDAEGDARDVTTTFTRIENYAFYGCQTIKNLYVPKTVTYIGKEAFKNCKIDGEIVVPACVLGEIETAFTDGGVDKATIISGDLATENTTVATDKITTTFTRADNKTVTTETAKSGSTVTVTRTVGGDTPTSTTSTIASTATGVDIYVSRGDDLTANDKKVVATVDGGKITFGNGTNTTAFAELVYDTKTKRFVAREYVYAIKQSVGADKYAAIINGVLTEVTVTALDKNADGSPRCDDRGTTDASDDIYYHTPTDGTTTYQVKKGEYVYVAVVNGELVFVEKTAVVTNSDGSLKCDINGTTYQVKSGTSGFYAIVVNGKTVFVEQSKLITETKNNVTTYLLPANSLVGVERLVENSFEIGVNTATIKSFIEVYNYNGTSVKTVITLKGEYGTSATFTKKISTAVQAADGTTATIKDGTVELIPGPLAEGGTDANIFGNEQCGTIKDVEIYDNVTVGAGALASLSAVENLTTLAGGVRLDALRPVGDNTLNKLASKGTLKTLKITSGIVKSDACSGYTALESLTIADRVVSVEDNAFSTCSGLKSLAVTSTNLSKFKSVSALTSLEILDAYGADGKPMPQEIFAEDINTNFANLNTIKIGAKTTINGQITKTDTRNITTAVVHAQSIKEVLQATNYSDGGKNRSTITTLEVTGGTIEQIGTKSDDGTVLEETALKYWYKDESWYTNEAGNPIVTLILDEDVTVENAAFKEMGTDIEKAIIPANAIFTAIKHVLPESNNGSANNKLTHVEITHGDIPANAFANFTALTNVVVGSGVTSVGENAFFGCNNISTSSSGNVVGWTTDGNVKYLGNSENPYHVAIGPTDTVNLTNATVTTEKTIHNTLELNAKCKFVEERAFADWTALRTVTIHYGTDITDNAFEGCTKIEELIVPANVCGAIPRWKMIVDGDEVFGNDSVKKVTVTQGAVSRKVFENFIALEEFTAKDGVHVINGYAFQNCRALRKFTAEYPEISISKNAFKDAVGIDDNGVVYGSLYDVKIPGAASEAIPKYKLAILEITGGVVPEFAFENCLSLAKLTVANGTQLKYHAFNGCEGLVQVVGNGAIDSNSMYQAYKPKNGNTVLEVAVDVVDHRWVTYTVADDKVLVGYVGKYNPRTSSTGGIDSYVREVDTTVDIPAGITEIYKYAFYKRSGLEILNISDSVTTIGAHAFEGCTALNRLALNHVQTIGERAFAGCYELARVNTGDSLTTITSDDQTTIGYNESAFDGCTTLVYIHNNNHPSLTLTKDTDANGMIAKHARTIYNNPKPESIIDMSRQDGYIVFIDRKGNDVPDDNTAVLMGYEHDDREIELPIAVKTKRRKKDSDGKDIKDASGNYEYELNTVVNEYGETIYPLYFGEDKLAIGELKPTDDELIYITEIVSDGFFNNEHITHIEIPEGYETIGESAFEGCTALEKVTIPKTVTSIGARAFFGASALKEVEWGGVTKDANDAFSEATTDEGKPQLRSIGERAFEHCYSLQEIYIPSGVTQLGVHTFCTCESLTRVVMPSVHTLGTQDAKDATKYHSDTFFKCSALTSVSMPKMQHIGDGAFYECVSLEELTLPVPNAEEEIVGVTDIGIGAFLGCRELKGTKTMNGEKAEFTFTIPASVTRIDYCAFDNCDEMTKVVIETKPGATAETPKLTKIDQGMFHNCLSLASITMPTYITEIGDGAFAGCESLDVIEIPDGIQKVGSHVFSGCTTLRSTTGTNRTMDGGVLYIGNSGNNGNGKYLIATNLTYTRNDKGEPVYNAKGELVYPSAITINDNCEIIAAGAFEDWKVITSVKLGSGLRVIGARAFHNTGAKHGDINGIGNFKPSTGNDSDITTSNVRWVLK